MLMKNTVEKTRHVQGLQEYQNKGSQSLTRPQEKRPRNLAGLSRFTGAALQSFLQQDLLYRPIKHGQLFHEMVESSLLLSGISCLIRHQVSLVHFPLSTFTTFQSQANELPSHDYHTELLLPREGNNCTSLLHLEIRDDTNLQILF